jgi:hypothetical protein
MTRAAFLAFAAALAVSACAADTRRLYKEGATQQDYARDSYDCERDTLAVASPYAFGRGFVAQHNARSFAIRCMIAKGYTFQ